MERLGTGDFRIRVPFWVAERSIGTNRGVGNLATGGRAGRRAVAIARRDAVEIRAEIIISSRARVGGDEVRPRDGGALDVREDRKPLSFLRTALNGTLINVLNPKLSLFFLAFLPQFVEAGSV